MQDNLDPRRKHARRVEFAEGKRVAAPGLKPKTDKINLESYRLNSDTGLLEYRKIFVIGPMWVPVIPNAGCSLVDEPTSWRKWLWFRAHDTFLNP